MAEQTIDHLLTQQQVQTITQFSASKLEQDRSKGVGIEWCRIGARAVRYRQSAVKAYCDALIGKV